jgi:hypothetical protein
MSHHQIDQIGLEHMSPAFFSETRLCWIPSPGRNPWCWNMYQNVPLIYHPNVGKYSYSHLLVITGYFYGIIHSINGVFLVLITGILGHNCRAYMENLRYKTTQHTTHPLESS